MSSSTTTASKQTSTVRTFTPHPRHDRWDLKDNMVVIGNIPVTATDADLLGVLTECKEVERHFLVPDKTNGKRKMALVEFRDISWALYSVDLLSGKTIRGARIVPFSVKETKCEIKFPSSSFFVASVNDGFKEPCIFNAFKSVAMPCHYRCYPRHGSGPFLGMCSFKKKEDYKKAADFVKVWRRMDEKSLFGMIVPTMKDFVPQPQSSAPVVPAPPKEERRKSPSPSRRGGEHNKESVKRTPVKTRETTRAVPPPPPPPPPYGGFADQRAPVPVQQVTASPVMYPYGYSQSAYYYPQYVSGYDQSSYYQQQPVPSQTYMGIQQQFYAGMTRY